MMAGMLKRVAPLSYEAWIDYDVCGARLSRMELDALRALVRAEGERLARRGGALDAAELVERGLAKREVGELLDKLAPPPAVPDFELDLAAAAPAPRTSPSASRKAVPSGEKPVE